MNFFRKSLILCTALLISSFAFSQELSIQNKMRHYQEKIAKYLDKKNALSPHYLIDTSGISIYDSQHSKLKNEPEFILKWNQINKFNYFIKSRDQRAVFDAYSSGTFVDKHPTDSPAFPSMVDIIYKKEIKRLSGLKIALDPGHLAGDLETGNLEKKYLHFDCDSSNGLSKPIELSEGMLTYATAILLKEKLEDEGAEVFMTRNYSGGSAYGMSFERWITQKNIDSLYILGELSSKQKKILMNPKATQREKFRFVFKDLELRKRAEVINNYHPDFTIIIHYNVDETNLGWTKPASNNFNMTFVGGAFMKNDLQTPEKRFEFLRLLINDDLEKSIALSSETISSFETILNVKTATLSDASYLSRGCLPTEKVGVYCRNLQLTRYVHSPLVYGETLYQDNINECVSLNKESDKTKNKRVQQVAESYFQGILKYTSK